jgi:tRNA 2-thiouridine synthesizing protein C
MKKILLIVRASPYGGIRGREALDAVMLFSAFAEEMSVLFSGDGVWQLLPGQAPAALGSKSVEAILGAFAAYDINRVYADAASLAERGIAATSLAAGARALDAGDLRALIAVHDRVVTL